jgi:hypothetical protein
MVRAPTPANPAVAVRALGATASGVFISAHLMIGLVMVRLLQVDGREDVAVRHHSHPISSSSSSSSIYSSLHCRARRSHLPGTSLTRRGRGRGRCPCPVRLRHLPRDSRAWRMDAMVGIPRVLHRRPPVPATGRRLACRPRAAAAAVAITAARGEAVGVGETPRAGHPPTAAKARRRLLLLRLVRYTRSPRPLAGCAVMLTGGGGGGVPQLHLRWTTFRHWPTFRRWRPPRLVCACWRAGMARRQCHDD